MTPSGLYSPRTLPLSAVRCSSRDEELDAAFTKIDLTIPAACASKSSLTFKRILGGRGIAFVNYSRMRVGGCRHGRNFRRKSGRTMTKLPRCSSENWTGRTTAGTEGRSRNGGKKG